MVKQGSRPTGGSPKENFNTLLVAGHCVAISFMLIINKCCYI